MLGKAAAGSAIFLGDVDAEEAGWGCSTRNGGQAQCASGRLKRSQWIERYGLDTAGLQRDADRPTGRVSVHEDAGGHRFVPVVDHVRRARVACVPLPATPGRVRSAIEGLRAYAGLAGGRGRAAYDMDGLCLAASRIGDLLLSEGLSLIEVNPLIVGHADCGAVDAVMT